MDSFDQKVSKGNFKKKFEGPLADLFQDSGSNIESNFHKLK